MDLLRRLKDRTLVLKPNRIQETVPSNIHTLQTRRPLACPNRSRAVWTPIVNHHLSRPRLSGRKGPDRVSALPAIALESCRMPLRSRGIVSSLKTTITQARSRFQPVNQLRYNHFPGLHCPSLRQRDGCKRTVERPQDKKNA
jgi:hypothetical protein